MICFKQYFLLGRLGLPDSPALDKAMSEVAETMGKSNRQKSRAVFYYLLTKYFDAEQTILTPVDGIFVLIEISCLIAYKSSGQKGVLF